MLVLTPASRSCRSHESAAVYRLGYAVLLHRVLALACIDKSCMGEDVISLLILCVSLGLQASAGKESDNSLAGWAGDMLGLGCAYISGRSQCCIP